MPTYEVRQGVTFGWDSGHIPGDHVEMSEGDAAPFLDKLSMVATDDREVFDSPIPLEIFPELSDHVLDSLKAAGITLDALPFTSDDEIAAIDGLGPSALAKIRNLYPVMQR